MALPFSPRALLIYSGAFLGLLMSKGLAFLPGFALDDYNILLVDRLPLFSIGQGRYTQAVLQSVLSYIHTSATSLAFASTLLFFLGASLSIATGILYATRRRGPALVHAAIAAAIGAHPYLTEYFSFRESLITQGTSFVLLGAAFTLVLRAEEATDRGFGAWRNAGIIACLVAVAGAQQTAFLVAVYFVLTRLTIDWIASSPSRDFRNVLRINASMLIVVASTAVLYAVIFVTTRKLAGAVADDRSALIAASDLGDRIPKVLALIGRSIFNAEPVLSGSVKRLMVATILGFAIFVGWRRPRAAIGALALGAVLTALSFVLLAISGVWWPVPRAMYGMAFASGLTLVVLSIWVGRGARAMLVLAATAAFALVLHSNTMLHDQWRLNRWDGWTAGTIAQQLLARGVRPDQEITLVGAPWYFPAGLRTVEGDLNVSALAVGWAAPNVFRETTGRPWNIHSESANLGVCGQGVAAWPSPDSIRMVDDRVFICMGP